MRLIALLGNPVDRAYSHYHHEVRMGRELLPFPDALEREAERLGQRQPGANVDEVYASPGYRRHSYLARGVYVVQLEAWMRVFPQEQLLVLRSEDLFSDAAAVLSTVNEFLRLPEWPSDGYRRKHNVGNYSPMDPSVRERLVDYFRPHNRRLREYLDIDLDWDR